MKPLIPMEKVFLLQDFTRDAKLLKEAIDSTYAEGGTALYDAVRLTIQGPSSTVDVMEVPDEVPTLIGQVPLELLDFVVDSGGQKLIGNPAHGGQHVLEAYWAKESK